MANLISFGDLFGQSLDLYEKNWKKLTIHTLWILVGVILGYIPYFGLIFLGQDQEPAVAVVMWLVGLILLLILVLPPSIRFHLAILKLAKGESAGDIGWNKVFAILIPTLLVGIIEGVLVLAGLIAFVIPGIWLSVALGFACYVLWDEGTKGFGAIKRSYQLVKGRWWATFVRLLVPGMVIGSIATMAMLVALLCLFIIFLLGAMLVGLLGTVSSTAALIVSVIGIILLIVAGLAAYLIPLFIMVPLSVIPTVKVYLNLKSTR